MWITMWTSFSLSLYQAMVGSLQLSVSHLPSDGTIT